MNFFNLLPNTDNPIVQNPTNPTVNQAKPTVKEKDKSTTMATKTGKGTPRRKKKDSAKHISPNRKAKASSEKKMKENTQRMTEIESKTVPTEDNSANKQKTVLTRSKNNDSDSQVKPGPSKIDNTPTKSRMIEHSFNKSMVQGKLELGHKSEVKIKQEMIDGTTVRKEEVFSKNQVRNDEKNNNLKRNGSSTVGKNRNQASNTSNTNLKPRNLEIGIDVENLEQNQMDTDETKIENEGIKYIKTVKNDLKNAEKKIIRIETDSDDKMKVDETPAQRSYKQASITSHSTIMPKDLQPTQQERVQELEAKGFKQAAEIKCFRKFYTRFQLIIPTPDNVAVKEAHYRNGLGKIIDVIRAKGCPKAVLLPYLNKDAGKSHITTYKRLEERMSTLELYFRSISRRVPYNKPNSSTIKKYVDILLAHDLEPSSLVNNVRDAIEALSPKVNIYLRENQAEVVKPVGWLFLSTWQMDTKEMGRAISEATGATCTCRFRQISNVKLMNPFKGAKPEVIKGTKAIHIETDETKYRVVKRFLDQFNSSTSRPRFVNDSFMRFVPEYQPNKVISSVKQSIFTLANKQYHACSGGMKYTALDGFMGDMNQPIQIEDTITSIRKIILNIPSHEDPQRFPFLFHAFEYLKDGPVIIFQASVNNEASYMVEHLVEYLRWKFGKHLVNQFFDIEVIREKKHNKWDADAWGVVSSEDKEFAAIANDNYFVSNKMFDLSEMEDGNKKNKARYGDDESSATMSFHLQDNDINTIASNQGSMSSTGEDTSSPITNSMKSIHLQVPLNAPERQTARPILKKKTASNKKHAAIIAQLRNDFGDNQQAFDLAIKALESQGILPPGTSA